jgi:hypothetical protein
LPYAVRLLLSTGGEVSVVHAGSEPGHRLGCLLVESSEIDLLVGHAFGPRLDPPRTLPVVVDPVSVFVLSKEPVSLEQRWPMLSQVRQISADLHVISDGHDEKLGGIGRGVEVRS